MTTLNLQKELPTPNLLLEAQRCCLRPAQLEDWQDWAALRAQNRACLTPWEPQWPADALTEEAYKRRLRRYQFDWQSDIAYNFHNFDRATGRLLGGINITQIQRGVSQTGVLSYWIGQAYARRGLTLEAVRLITKFAFTELDLHRLEATCMPANEASKNLLEKLGFAQEGYVRGYLKIAGQWEDHYLYGLIKP